MIGVPTDTVFALTALGKHPEIRDDQPINLSERGVGEGREEGKEKDDTGFCVQFTSCVYCRSIMIFQQVIGVPTDTVYALAASVKHPQMIKRLYNVKGRPAHKPICLCLASLQQLRDVDPPFSDLLWNFMDKCYPGG